MREITVSIEVFAKIWVLRQAGESDENAILSRVLDAPRQSDRVGLDGGSETSPVSVGLSAQEQQDFNEFASTNEASKMEVTTNYERDISAHSNWWEVTYAAIANLGGEAQLHYIYKETERICKKVGKRIPKTLDATVRGTLEDNCAESHRYKQVRDVFEMTRGRGQGTWGLRRD